MTHSIVVSLSIHHISNILMDVFCKVYLKHSKVALLVPILNVGVKRSIVETFNEEILEVSLSSEG